MEYTLWLRGYPTNAAGDSAYVSLGDQVVDVTGFGPGQWEWANQRISESANGVTATLPVSTTGLLTLTLSMREDGLRVDRLLLVTDTTPTVPSADGPAETDRQLTAGGLIVPLTRTIVYTYDHLYRLTDADYSTHSTLPAVAGQAGEVYTYTYDPASNREQQTVAGEGATTYQYDDANRLTQVSGPAGSFTYVFDKNGNLTQTGMMTNTWDAANRLVTTTRDDYTLKPIYNGVGDRIGQTAGVTTTHFALDVQGLPEVIYTSQGEAFLHLPGIIVVRSEEGEVQYLLSDGLGSVRQATDEAGAVVASYEFDPYGNPVDNNGGDPYGYTGEWWESYLNLLYLRARWYAVETGTFLSRDPVENIIFVPSTANGYNYANQNSINLTDPSGLAPLAFEDPWQECMEMKTCRDLVFIVLEEGGTAVPKAVISISAGVVGVLVIVPGGLTLICTVWDCSPAPSMPPQPVPTPRQDPSPTGTPVPGPQMQQQPQPQSQQNPQTQTQPLPQPLPVPVPVPPPTCPEEPKEIHISLGFVASPRGGSLLLGPFTDKLNRELNSQNIYVYGFRDWPGNVVDKDVNVFYGSGFAIAFDVATQKVPKIHFNLEGIKGVIGIDKHDAYIDFAENFGSKGDLAKSMQAKFVPPYITADELYLIRKNPTLCQKTIFYRRGSLTTADKIGNTQICTQ